VTASGTRTELIDGLLARRAAAGAAYFGAHEEALARLCHRMAERFARGGRLVALGRSPAARSDVRHVTVEFVHPVIVGKRALPAIGLAAEGGALDAQAALVVEAGDIAIAFEAAEPQTTSALALARERGALTVAFAPAGAEWNEREFGLSGLITNLGRLNGIDEVAKLYRTCDIGFVYMLSKHPSYQPFEFMASGMATVTNNNEDNLWFLQDGTNCLIAEPSAAAMAEKIGWLIEDPKLLAKIQEGGYKSVTTDWQRQIDLVWNDISKSAR